MTGLDSSKERLRQFLHERGITYVSDVRASRSPAVDFVLFVSGERVSSRSGRRRTSARQMSRVSAEIKARLGLTARWIVTQDSRVVPLETVVSLVLAERFPGVFARVFVSMPHGSPEWVWMETDPQSISRPSEDELRKVIADIFRPFGWKPPGILYSDSAELPDGPTILRELKTISPASAEALAERLRDRGALVPAPRWLRTKLDTLRRKGLVIREQGGRYAMTEKGLAVVPWARTRASSDVERALALARRKW